MPIRPICFMVMPYGTKPTNVRPGAVAPAKINFNRLWDAALRPAIESLGYDPVRADQDLGALIITQMIERLAISELVVADVTIANSNVYYEVGIRHAAVNSGCVMIAANWAEPLFDINQMRQVRYPLPDEEVSEETAAQIRAAITDPQTGIPHLAAGGSPFYDAVPGFPNIDPSRVTSFKKELEQLAEFQGQVQAVRSAPSTECRDRALLLRDTFFKPGPAQKVVALELLYLLRDCTDWKIALEFINGLPEDVRKLPVVQEQLSLAQSKTGDHTGAIATLRTLIQVNGDSSERRGLLGGRFKELQKKAASAADKSRFLNQAIDEYEKGMRLDLNDYYPSSNLPRLYRQRKKKGDEDRARVAGAVALVGCERARARDPQDKWLKPTLLGAAFDSGDVETAAQLADEIEIEGAVKWQLETTLNDLEMAISFHDAERAQELRDILDRLKNLLPAPATS